MTAKALIVKRIITLGVAETTRGGVEIGWVLGGGGGRAAEPGYRRRFFYI